MSTVSPTIKAFRWGFLVAGFLYGASKAGSLTKQENALRAKEEKAAAQKAEVAKKQQEEAAKSSTVISDPTNPAFDLEKFLLSVEKQPLA
eukprot:m.355302 g.355302  ORF g.355302 m.355302 type:complete len:90 (+) comp17214_c0_seq1:50-319(+)